MDLNVDINCLLNNSAFEFYILEHHMFNFIFLLLHAGEIFNVFSLYSSKIKQKQVCLKLLTESLYHCIYSHNIKN